ncbi:hypothetical protein [Nitrosomonas ureae]|uniref:Uncharacterized protein n=1 Tax=Nitrosomonas ureae TaxID=44577 RepID=A0A1H9AJH5_9PROT|nr:hypothetical protein [Nitrosomonas ureae]SEP76906.1 hypothetical protein SAMN05421510_10048 [Nitrosomonas ureae]
MSNRNSNDTPNEATQSHTGRKPDRIAYTVRKTQNGKEYWNRVGASFEHKDGRGSELILDSIPMDGRITLREQRDQRMQDYQDERAKQQPVNNTRTRDHGHER